MKSLLALFFFSVMWLGALAHPMPNSVLLLDVKGNDISAELYWPLKELQLAFPNEDIDVNVNTLISRKGEWLDQYLLNHVTVSGADGKRWKVIIIGKSVDTGEQSYTGKYHELLFKIQLIPPPHSSPRCFVMQYDAIMHQVVTHKLLLRIQRDWDGGLSEKDSANADLGVLMVNTTDGKIPPVVVNLDEGSKWKGFKNMVAMGMHHISEGTDHLLFLLVLMLPAPLIAAGGRWTKSGGTKYSAIRLLKIATAFTIGHSITLLIGALGWLQLPGQPVEILIAVSILVGAVHALRPIFPGKEVFIAAGFGLIHGLAFAVTLANLHVDTVRMVLSILGFNIGIELMQLFIILLFIPWLILLSPYKIYQPIRIIGGTFAFVASVAWIVERISMRSNKLSEMLQVIGQNGKWVILGLALIALITHWVSNRKMSRSN